MKLFSSFILSLCSVMGFSQTILYQAESTTRTVQDPQTVVLAQGFTATGNVSNPFVAKIGPATENPGGGPTDSNAGANIIPGTTAPNGKSFHDTVGNIEVASSGQLQYNLALSLPIGIKDVTPKLDLTYLSSSGNGIAGYGWSVSGVTSISRIGKNIEKDGELKGVQLNYSDYYSFNGQRLILKSGVYGQDGAEYVTEKYSNVKIKSFGAITGQIWQGPEYWEVTFEDGAQAWYGGVSNSNNAARNQLEYNIVKWKDKQGNYITYNYLQNNNIPLLSSIQWGGNENLGKAHFNTVQFNYLGRSITETFYKKGILFKQDKILGSITILSKNSVFKNYYINYSSSENVNDDSTYNIHYQFVTSVTETNKAGESANQAEFFTKPLKTKVNEYNFNDYGDIVTTGDFNGDGLVDFIAKKYMPGTLQSAYYLYFDAVNAGTNYVYLGTDANLFPGFISNTGHKTQLVPYNLKSSDNYVKTKQGILTISSKRNISVPYEPYMYDIELRYFSIKNDASVLNTNNNALVLEYSKTIGFGEYQYDPLLYPNQPDPGFSYVDDEEVSAWIDAKEVDIDSDGLSEIMLSIADVKCYKKELSTYPEDVYSWECANAGSRFIVIDKDDVNNNTFHTTAPMNKNLFQPIGTGRSQIMDFDNDGTQDIILVEPTGTYSNVNFYTKNLVNSSVQNTTINTSVNKLSQYEVKREANEYVVNFKNSFTVKGLPYAVQFGDLNGDNNIEVLLPLHEYNVNDQLTTGWSIYQNTGTDLEESLQGLMIYRNYPTSVTDVSTNPALIDIDGDGKGEIINSYSWFSNINTNLNVNWRLDSFSEAYYNPSDLQFKWRFQEKRLMSSERAKSSIQPLFGNFRVNGTFSKILFLLKATNSNERKVISYEHYNINFDKNITKIKQGGITYDIDYTELNPATNANIYSTIKKEQYPYVELERLDQTYAVSQIRYLNRKQDFRYRGYITHLQGRGIVGFRQTARSSWYADGLENTKIWSGREIDPLNYGVPVKEWSIRTNDESKIFPTDISENNTQLLSYKSIVYENNSLLNGQPVSTILDSDKPKIVTAIVPKSNFSKDFLTNTTTSSLITYGDYYLPVQSISNINNGYGVKTSIFEYSHNPSGTGINYYIGRPTSKIDIIQAYSDSKSIKEEYSYDNNLLKTLKTWNRDNSGFLLETYNYDNFGNITQKVTSNSLDFQTQTAKSEYDPDGRFIVKKTDNLQLQTSFSYNDFGQIVTQIDPLNNTLNNTYDDWGKLLKSKNNLEGTTSYQYNRDDNANITVTQYYPDGDISKTYTDIFKQEYKSSTKAFGQGLFVSKDIQYDIIGRKIRESEPYFEGQSNILWNTINYNDSVFPPKITAQSFSEKQTETSISGLTTTIKETNPADYGRINTKTADALGNIISTTDKGGTINFTYNAAGEQIKAQYAENIVTSKYDAWGKKSELNDPSNGVYKYEYDGFGQTKKTISPKGTKEFIYNNLGQLITQKELSTADGGQATNKVITYTYDNKGRVISRSGTSKGKAYSSNINYDPQGRMISRSEAGNGKYFIQKGITYDDKGRVISYEKELFSSGIMTKVNIENVYSAWDGELYQIKDQTSGKVLWQLNETNAKGQAINSKLGEVSINNNYNINSGFLTSVLHSSQNAVVLQMAYTFNAIRNKLESRTRGGDFNITETFDYDDNNRLINWTDPGNGIKPSTNRNIYDIKGRILENDQVGIMKYENTSKIYQPTGMTLNAKGEQNYNNDLIQTITYNENNDPVFIDGMKGDVAFQYGLTSMRQRVNYGGNFAADGDGTFTKFYSEDGSFEVQVNNTTGAEKHILYIGGSPYESNIIFVKNYAETIGSYKFLHKDYLGSVLAITDEAGNNLEQRHFDAWGNMTHYKKGNKAIVTDRDQINMIIANGNLLIDRGYTGHEYFPEVGIIHMNGRLYDPLLRRFLNADENIQDPTNTQNYNKYGYVLNNPLMFNDPSGEFFIAISIPVIIVGALKAVVIAGLLYTAMAAITGNASKAGFLKSMATSFITGGIGAGIGALNVFGNGFWGTVAQGISIGAAGGAVDAIASGNNILKGVIKGAVIGGAVAAVSYTVNYYVKGLYKPQEVTTNDVSVNESEPVEADLQKMGQNIKTARASLPVAKDNNISFEGVGLSNPEGYMLSDNGKTWNVLGRTSPVDFISGKQTILYSARAASNLKLLGRIMSHETAHAMSNAFKFPKKYIRKRLEVVDDLALDTVDHLVIRKLEYTLLYKNFLLPTGQGLPSMEAIDTHISLLNPSEKFLFDYVYNRFLPLFNVQYKFPVK